MSRFPAVLALVLAGCGGERPSAPASPGAGTFPPAPGAVRVMPIGDSITQANTETDSYRRPLWALLQAASLRADFVGSERDNHGGPPPHPDFDLDHEGHWGWRADEVAARLDAWARAAQPDVALVHLGSNDVFQGEDDASTVDDLAAVVARLRAANPRVTVLLAQLVPTTRTPARDRIPRLNASIASLASRLDSQASRVVAVDQHTGFDAAGETRDGIHPNEAGEAKMARVWMAALQRHWPKPAAAVP